MLIYRMIVPTCDRPVRKHFTEWLDRLQHAGICAQVYRNSSEDTAELLDRAHGPGVFLVRICHTSSYLIGAEERAENVMRDITEKIQLYAERHLVLEEEYEETYDDNI